MPDPPTTFLKRLDLLSPTTEQDEVVRDDPARRVSPSVRIWEAQRHLVADPTDGRRRGTDEDDAKAITQLDALGVLRDEPPPDPRRIGLHGRQRLLAPLVVEIGQLPLPVAWIDE